MLSIDVVIPSYRLQSEYLVQIIEMDAPTETLIRYIIVVDNPECQIPNELGGFLDDKKVTVLRNLANLGASATRNVGIDQATGEWILFLDDDIKPSKSLLNTYVNAIKANPDSTGFFGEVIFPTPSNSFEQGMKLSDLLAFFSLAGKTNQVKWTPTANVIINRSAIGEVRFNDRFPKNGAGEEVDFFLKIYKKTGKELQAVKNAEVYHKWWNNGKRTYTRFIRWSYGQNLLLDLFPEYTYYNFPNILECGILALPLVLLTCIYMHTFLPAVCFLLGLITGEFVGEFLNIVFHKGISNVSYTPEVVLIKISAHIGRLKAVFKKSKFPKRLCLRFDFFCNINRLRNRRMWGGIRFALYIICSFVFYITYLVFKSKL